MSNSASEIDEARRRRAGGLKATQVKEAKPRDKPYKLADERGLFLLVLPGGSRHWRWKFRFQGKERQAAFGSYPEVSLAAARERMEEARRLLKAGKDPVAEKKAQATPAPVGRTFKEVAEAYLAAHREGWRNAKHAAQWGSTLATYAYPTIGAKPVADVAFEHVKAILDPIWKVKPETAGRVRGRIEAVLDYAKVEGWRTGENPALWKGNLAHAFPARGKVRPVKHHAAMDWREIGGFMPKLHKQQGVGARALEFAILTAARSGEVRGARWNEIDGAVWKIPGERMKARVEHSVPLSDAALAVLVKMRAFYEEGGLIFPGAKSQKPLSDMSLSAVLRRMKLPDITVHGFRSSFRDWAGESTNFPRDVCEAALAHTIQNKVEAAYRRGQMLEKRRKLMVEWAEYCLKPLVDQEDESLGSSGS